MIIFKLTNKLQNEQMSRTEGQKIQDIIRSGICPECSLDISLIIRSEPISKISITKCPRCDYPIWIKCPVCDRYFRIDLECKKDPSHTDGIPINVRSVMSRFINSFARNNVLMYS